MKLIRQFFRLFIYSNFFISACAVLMVWQTHHLFSIQSQRNALYGFVFFSTLASYSFHWYLTRVSVLPSRRIAWTRHNRHVLGVLLATGLAGAIFFFIPLIAHWKWIAGAAIPTFLYTAPKIPLKLFRQLRKVAAGKTVFLALVWTYVSAILPLAISSTPWGVEPAVYTLGRFFLIYAICLLFDYRDREDDRINGVHSFITYMNERYVSIFFYGSLLMAAVFTMWLAWFEHPLHAVAMLAAPLALLAIVYPYTRKNFSDMLYYFLLDGTMALSALLLLLSRI